MVPSHPHNGTGGVGVQALRHAFMAAQPSLIRKPHTRVPSLEQSVFLVHVTGELLSSPPPSTTSAILPHAHIGTIAMNHAAARRIGRCIPAPRELSCVMLRSLELCSIYLRWRGSIICPSHDELRTGA